MIEDLCIEFVSSRSVAPEDLRTLLVKLNDESAQSTEYDPNTLLYIGKKTEFLPEDLPADDAIDAIVRDGQGSIQFWREDFDYLVQVNPTGQRPVAVDEESTHIVISIDGTHFDRADSVPTTDIVELVRLVGTCTAWKYIVGYGIDTGPSDPVPAIKQAEVGTEQPIPVHWLTYIPSGIGVEDVQREAYEWYSLGSGELYLSAPSPIDFDEIERFQRLLIEA